MSRTQLRDILWGELDQQHANASMRQLMARVRGMSADLGADILLSDWHHVALNDEFFEVDLAQLISLNVEEAIQRRDRPILEQFAVSYTGELCAGLQVAEPSFDDWLSEMRDRLRRNVVDSLRILMSDVHGSDVQTQQRFAHRLLRIDSTQELGYRVLMETYVAQGERALSLKAYRKCCDVLRTELGVEPEDATHCIASTLGLTEGSFPRSVGSVPVGGLGPRCESGNRLGQPKLVVLSPVTNGDERVATKAAAVFESLVSRIVQRNSLVVVVPHAGRLATHGQSSRGRTRDTGTEYVLHATVSQGPSNVALIFRLCEAETSVVLWSTEIDVGARGVSDAIELSIDRVAHDLVEAIERAELCFAAAPGHETAYRLYLEGRASMRNSDLPHLRRARRRFRQSLDLYGAYAPALAGLARTYCMERVVLGVAEDAFLKEAIRLADLAIKADPFDARGMRERGFALLYLRRHEESIRCFENAFALNPHHADLLADYADILAHSGQPGKAREMCLKAINLNPRHPDYYDWILGGILYQLGEYEVALEAMEHLKMYPASARLLAACSAMAGRHADACQYSTLMLDNYPDFVAEDLFQFVPDKDARDTSHMVDGLRLAGLK